MEWYSEYKLIEDGDGYTLEIYLNKDLPEFADEFLSRGKENVLKLDDKVKKLINDKFSDLKINTAKLLIGTIVVATIPFYAGPAVAAAAAPQAASQAETSTTGTVTATQLNVRAGPSTANSIMHVLWNGNKVRIIDESGGWYRIRLSDGRTGWVSKTYMSVSATKTGTVTATRLNVRNGPSTSNSIVHVLWNGNIITVIGESGNWYNIRLSDGRIGWVSKDYLQVNGANTVNQTQQKIDKVIATAKSLVGTPYVWGGESLQEGGFDCSGFTQYVYKQAGYSLPRISADQATQGLYVSYANMKPGDLVFASFNQNAKIDHVGIYIGNGQMIHSPKAGDTVKITNINVAYWQQRHVTSRRIIY